MTSLDLDFVRAQFPAFSHRDTEQWAHLENAGGSYVPKQVIDLLNTFMTATKVQPYWDFEPSARAGAAMDLAKSRLPATFNAGRDDTHFGPSTTQNTYVLAQALRTTMTNGDEVIVTNQDHEANIGSWRRLSETGIVVKEWGVDPTTGMLDLSDLRALLTDRTALVAVTHASNVAATINPIWEIAQLVHAHDGLLCVDGVAYAPHATIDVQELGCDIYLYSAYKTYGPHVGMMYVTADLAQRVGNQGHYFNAGSATGRLVPAGPNHAEVAATAGIMGYYDAVHEHHFGHRPVDDANLLADVFGLFAAHEQSLMEPLGELLTSRDGVRLVGSPLFAHTARAPTFAFATPKLSSSSIYQALIDARVSCGYGHFYAPRLLSALDLDLDDGVVRLSLVHYNSPDEIERALNVLDAIL